MANIFLSIPVLDKPELSFMYSMFKAATSTRHNVKICYHERDSLISRARNVAISTFYNQNPEADYFISLDSDLNIRNCHPNNNIFDKLVAHDIDFVGGLYAIKKPNCSQCSSITIDGKLPEFNSGLKEAPWLSTGCWCLKRSAVEKMVNAYPELEYDGDDIAAGQKIHALYMPMIHEMTEKDFPDTNKDLPYKKYLSEDWSFCQRWRQLGGSIYADSSIVLEHIGKFSYKLYDVEEVVVPRPASPTIPAPGFDLENKL